MESQPTRVHSPVSLIWLAIALAGVSILGALIWQNSETEALVSTFHFRSFPAFSPESESRVFIEVTNRTDQPLRIVGMSSC